MKRVLVAGAGGPASEGVIRSLQGADGKYEVIGMGSDSCDLMLSSASRKYLVPNSRNPKYFESLKRILLLEKPDFIHAQNDHEVLEISRSRESIRELGVSTFLPKHSTIETCVDKWKSFCAFDSAGIKVPRNVLINTIDDLDEAFSCLADDDGKLWLRANEIGGGGIGALPTSNRDFAKAWIDHHQGWTRFLAAEVLTEKTVTWLSIWFQGELVIAQSRARGGWVHGNRTLSGVTGVTKIGRTISDDKVNEVALAAILAVDPKPHGIFGVDMAYDKNGIPNPTEINIGRFFTTVQFFTLAGVNFPDIYLSIGTGEQIPNLDSKINPIEPNLLWLRGMDVPPKLSSEAEFGYQILEI
jgi:hypothetical protein